MPRRAIARLPTMKAVARMPMEISIVIGLMAVFFDTRFSTIALPDEITSKRVISEIFVERSAVLYVLGAAPSKKSLSVRCTEPISIPERESDHNMRVEWNRTRSSWVNTVKMRKRDVIPMRLNVQEP